MVTTTYSGASEAKYLTAKQAANYLGYSIAYLYQLTCKHAIPYYNPTGRKILIKREELEAWIEKGRVRTDEELSQNI